MTLRVCSATLLALVSLLPIAVTGQALPAPDHFYPYGPGVGDTTAPVNDDGSSGKILISTLFPYFDKVHDSLYVYWNGLISFFPRNVSHYVDGSFPLPEKGGMVAAFWADVDTRENSGRVFYRETTDRSILNRATDDVRRAFVRLTRFSATWVFVASWHKVTYYGGSSTTPVNTFQIVLITNGRHSFTILNYGNITWTTGIDSGGSHSTGLGGSSAQVGFNAGDGLRYFSVPGSRQAAIVDVETTTNVGLPGRWMFQVDDVSVEAGGCNTGGTLSVGPRFGPMLGGLTVTVSGPCFDDLSNTSGVVCKFSEVETPADVIDATRAQCVLPMLMRTGRIPLAISTDGGQSYNHTGAFMLVAEYERESVTLVKSENITWGDFNKTLEITWPRSYFNETLVDIDFVSFTYDGDQKLQTLVIPVEKSVANVGRLTLPTRLRLATVLAPEPVGSLRVRAAGSTDDNHDKRRRVRSRRNLFPTAILWTTVVKAVWSAIDFSQWYLNSYVKEMHERGDTSTIDRILEILCLYWYQGEMNNPPSSDGLPACPCTRLGANADDRFIDDPACSNGDGCDKYHPGAYHCIRSASASSLGAGQQCCYDKSGSIITDFDKGGGTFDRSHYKGHFGTFTIPFVSHLWNDVRPYSFCCGASSKTNCAKYGEVRSTDDCSDYEPPISARNFGDPHVITLDGLHYTFNGLGEFWLVRSAHFLMQGRATQVTNTQGDLVKGTSWTAVAMGLVDIGTVANGTVVQAQVNERTGLDIFMDGVKQDFDDLPTQDWPDVTVTYNAANMTADFRFHGDKEYAIRMTVVEGSLSYSFTWPRGVDAPCGLLGNANGNADDDLQTLNDVSLPSNVTARQLYEEFGLIWRTTEGESLFVYDTGSSHATFIDPSFEPLFELPPTYDSIMARVTRVCGGSEECVYDYLVTGKKTLALASADAVKQYEVFIEATTKVVSCGSLKTPSNGTKNGSSPLVGAIANFSCYDGFRLRGSVLRICTEQGEWSGVDVSCVEVSCDVLNTPLHGTKNESSLLLGTVVTFSCNDGFRLEGSAQRTCTEQGEWNGTDVSCLAEVAKSSANSGGLAGLTIGVIGAIIGLLFV